MHQLSGGIFDDVRTNKDLDIKNEKRVPCHMHGSVAEAFAEEVLKSIRNADQLVTTKKRTEGVHHGASRRITIHPRYHLFYTFFASSNHGQQSVKFYQNLFVEVADQQLPLWICLLDSLR